MLNLKSYYSIKEGEEGRTLKTSWIFHLLSFQLRHQKMQVVEIMPQQPWILMSLIVHPFQHYFLNLDN
jgi:hypothetical protein